MLNELSVRFLQIISDSQAAIRISNIEEINYPNKHIRMPYRLFRDLATQKTMLLEHKSTTEMVSDFLTKVLSCAAIKRHRVCSNMATKGERTAHQKWNKFLKAKKWKIWRGLVRWQGGIKLVADSICGACKSFFSCAACTRVFIETCSLS